MALDTEKQKDSFEKVYLSPDGRREGFTSGGEPWIEVPSRIFEAGNYGTRDYSEAEVQHMADYFQANQKPVDDNSWKVPIQKLHSSDPDDTRGSVRDVWTQAKELWAILRFQGKAAVEKVRADLYKRLSAGIVWDKETPEKPYLDEVTVTPFPRVATAQTFSSKTGGSGMKTCDGMEMSDEAYEAYGKMSDDEKAAYAKKNKPAPKEPDADDMARKAAADAAKDTFAKEREAFEQRIARLEADANEAKKRERFTRDAADVERWVKDGRTAPSCAKEELAVLQSLDEKQREGFAALKAKQEPLIEFGRKSTPAIAASGEDFMKEVDDLLKDAGLTKNDKSGKWGK